MMNNSKMWMYTWITTHHIAISQIYPQIYHSLILWRHDNTIHFNFFFFLHLNETLNSLQQKFALVDLSLLFFWYSHWLSKRMTSHFGHVRCLSSSFCYLINIGRVCTCYIHMFYHQLKLDRLDCHLWESLWLQFVFRTIGPYTRRENS